jgi:hypothetical protein
MLEIHRSRSSLANSSQPRCTISNRVPSGQSVLLQVACFDFCDRSSLNTTIRRYCRGVRSAGHPIWRATVSAFTAAGSSWYSRNSYRTPSVSSSHTALGFMLFSVAYQVRLAVSPDSPKRPGRFPAPASFMGSNPAQKPICVLAEPLVSDRVAVPQKNGRTSRRPCCEASLPVLWAGRLVPSKCGSNPSKSKNSSLSASERILPGTRFLSMWRNSVKPFMALATSLCMSWSANERNSCAGYFRVVPPRASWKEQIYHRLG